jgi:hypothetical protein
MGMIDDVREVAKDGIREAQLFASTPQARRARAVLATGLIAAAPVITRHPYMRASRVMRLLGVAGGAAVIVKVAETIRDWEPDVVAGNRG